MLPYYAELESGLAWQTRNDVQIPAESGTRFSIAEFGRGPDFAWRLYAGWRPSERHELRALAAPLTLTRSGKFDKDVQFQNETFVANQTVTARYKFDSYRLTYRYKLLDDANWETFLGFTGKIRVAEIKLTQESKSASRSNVGFVPLLHAAASFRFTPSLSLRVDADFLASPQGRAEDVALLAQLRPSDQTWVQLGYRTVEGGSDGGGKVYTFAWLHYLVLGIGGEI